MMIVRSDKRGVSDYGWLHSRHTFSFGSYNNPDLHSWGALRVINEDVVEGGGGFDTHPHRDMEIISYVIEGRLAHKDSTGSGGVLGPGEVQVMTAGRGILHSEFNGSSSERVHFLQIWITPRERGLIPRHEQRNFNRGSSTLIVSGDGREGSLKIAQDVSIYSCRGGGSSEFQLGAGRRGWIQVVRGAVTVAGQELLAGDGAGFHEARSIEITYANPSEILLFDLP